MLQLILSGVGGGKTTRIMETIRNFSENESIRMTLIVPEQYSFTCQKNLLQFIGPEKMTRVDALSFTELGEKLIGKPALFERRRLSDAGAAVIMSSVLKSLKSELKLFGRHAEKRSSVNEFLALSSEFKQNMISPSDIQKTIESMDESLLKAKLSDIALVLGEYDRRVSESRFNPDDLLTELSGMAELDAYFNNRVVFIDSFRGFTAQEYAIIEHIMKCAKEVYVALCSYDLENNDDVTDLFAKTKNTASRLKNIEKKLGLTSQVPQYLSHRGKYNNFPPRFERYSCPELTALEKNLYSDNPHKYEENCDNITLCRASDIYTECDWVASRIKKLLRENNYRCRDIAVIARNIDSYAVPLRSSLHKCGIDIYEDSRRSADYSPVTGIISAAVSAAAKNFDNDSIMRYLKTGLTGLTTEEVSDLENYCYLWQISGKKWNEDWTAGPNGFEGANPEADKSDLERLNTLRKRAVYPLFRLKLALKGGVSGEEAIKAIWHLAEEIGLSDNVTAMAEQLNSIGEESSVRELGRMWTLLVETINELEELISGDKVTCESLSETLDIMFSVKTMGNIPQGLDEVIIGSADRIRISAPKVTFVIGANEGVFPPEFKCSSALTLKERAKMEELGLELSGNGEWLIADEKLIAYTCVCSPVDKLFVSCSNLSAGGDELLPCEFYNTIRRLFTQCREESTDCLDGMFFTEGRQMAFEQLAKSQNSPFRETLKEYFKGDSEYSGKIVSLQRAAGGRNFSIINKNISELLFGRSMTISASRIESYYNCAFMYFCKYGIKAKPRKIAELDPAQTGNVSHYVMEHLLTDYPREQLMAMAEEELFAIIKSYTTDYLENELAGMETNDRFMFLYSRLCYSLTEVAKRLIEEFATCDFIPVDFELPIGPNEEVEPYIPGGSDGNIRIIGKVDRVDIAESDGRKYLRVVDYKSKQKEFKLGDVIQGINMQMLIYLFTLWTNGSKKYGDVTPAGVLYYNATDKVVSAELDDDIAKIESKRSKEGRMTGIVLDDSKVITLMEHNADGKFIPASLSSKDGSIKGNTINLHALSKLKEKTDSLIVSMADMLRDGTISAVPSCSTSGYLPCSYCDYKSVCGYEDGIPVNQRFKADNKEAIKLLEEGDEGIGTELEQ